MTLVIGFAICCTHSYAQSKKNDSRLQMYKNTTEIIELQKQVKQGKYEGFKEKYINELSVSLQDIIDKLPGKKKELDEIAKAKGKEAERLKAEAELRAKVEADNRAKAEIEAREKAEMEAAFEQQLQPSTPISATVKDK